MAEVVVLTTPSPGMAKGPCRHGLKVATIWAHEWHVIGTWLGYDWRDCSSETILQIACHKLHLNKVRALNRQPVKNYQWLQCPIFKLQLVPYQRQMSLSLLWLKWRLLWRFWKFCFHSISFRWDGEGRANRGSPADDAGRTPSLRSSQLCSQFEVLSCESLDVSSL